MRIACAVEKGAADIGDRVAHANVQVRGGVLVQHRMRITCFACAIFTSLRAASCGTTGALLNPTGSLSNIFLSR